MSGVETKITDSHLLTDLFGYWPSFHDAELLRLHIDRGEETERPFLEAWVYAFEMTSEIDPKGYYKLRHKINVHFRFDGIDNLELSGLNGQNALMGLVIKDISDLQLEELKFSVSFDASFGADMKFDCTTVRIVDIEKLEESL